MAHRTPWQVWPTVCLALSLLLIGCDHSRMQGNREQPRASSEHLQVSPANRPASHPDALPSREIHKPERPSAEKPKRGEKAHEPSKKPTPTDSPPAVSWLTDYSNARQLARQTGKPIFVVFR